MVLWFFDSIQPSTIKPRCLKVLDRTDMVARVINVEVNSEMYHPQRDKMAVGNLLITIILLQVQILKINTFQKIHPQLY